jgi:threonine/homoserine/homoserine lactone efflux protein
LSARSSATYFKLAGIGVPTIVLLFLVAFTALKFADIAYLVYLAAQAWRAPMILELDPDLRSEQAGPGRYFMPDEQPRQPQDDFLLRGTVPAVRKPISVQ